MGQDQVSGGVSVLCWLAAPVAMFYGNLQNLDIFFWIAVDINGCSADLAMGIFRGCCWHKLLFLGPPASRFLIGQQFVRPSRDTDITPFYTRPPDIRGRVSYIQPINSWTHIDDGVPNRSTRRPHPISKSLLRPYRQTHYIIIVK